ncbi:MAG: GTPase Era [Spirochaetales bacterium]|nr:GTPase Era [Spirochaetales bacterium]
MKSAFIAIVGRPSSGKSTFINWVCGHKVSIVSPTPQTTRNKIRGIVHRPGCQFVFVDTPGYHNSDKKFNLYMKELVESVLGEIDLVLYLIDGTRKPGQEEHDLLTALEPYKNRVFAAVNKSDDPLTVKNRSLSAFLEESDLNDRLYSISAKTGDGIDALLLALEESAPEGDPYYPEEFYTDQEPAFRAAEIIREKAIAHAKQELPHSIYVEIADMEETRKPNNRGVMTDRLWIRAFLTVERDSQKGILVGKGGSIIKTIRFEAERELRTLFPRAVDLDLQVKVHKKWRTKDPLLRRLVR